MNDAPRTILLVEDEMLIASDEQRELEEEGYEVFVVTSGSKAIQFVTERAGRLNLILMDINLGRGMDGTEAARDILEKFDVPIIFLSNYTDPGTIAKTQNVSSYGFVVKSSGAAVLLASIRIAINLHAALLELKKPEGGPAWENDLGQFLSPPRARADSVLHLQAALESAADAILIVARDGTITGFNARFARLWGIPEEILAEKNNEKALAFVLRQLKNPDAFLAKVRELHGRPEDEGFDELEFNDGRIFERYSYPQIIDGTPVGRVSSFRDVTGQRRAVEALRESEERHRLIASLTTDYFFRLSVGNDGRVVMDQVSSNFPEITGRSAGEADTPDLWDSVIQADDLGRVKDELRRLLVEGGTSEIECRSIVRGSRWRWISVLSRALRSPDQSRTTAIVGAVKDIHDRKTAEESLKQALAQKDLLMREMRHRIKNSLAVVSGLLTLETENISHPESRDILRNTRSRILSISTIYDILNQSSDPSRIDLKTLAGRLIESLARSPSGAGRRVMPKSNLEDLPLDAQRAFPFALILNELVINAFRHAYPGDKGGEIRIDLWKTDGAIRLRVEDDGVGWPEGLDPKTAETTGLSLIRILAEQIDAVCTFTSEGGVKATVVFPE